MRRALVFVLALALVCPVAAIAGDADQDPDGVSQPVSAAGYQEPALSPWLDSVLRVLLMNLGL